MTDPRDHRAGSPTDSIPVTFIGAGSRDLETSTSDPRALRDLLDRARERLKFYEGFDRVIAENIRRSGELMLETIALREQEREFEQRSVADQQRHVQLLTSERANAASLIDTLNTDLSSLRSAIDHLATTLSVAEQELVVRIEGSTAPIRDEPSTDASPVTAPMPSGPELAPRPRSLPDQAEESPLPAARDSLAETVIAPSDEPVVLTVIAHGISRAATAISLQRFLAGLDAVRDVDAREFSSGILRLQVAASAPLTAEAMSDWADGGPISVLQAGGDVFEIEVHNGATASR